MNTIDIQVISLREDPTILDHLRKDFGEKAGRAPAVDMRAMSPNNLAISGIISLNAADTLETGRKWHKELTSTGTVGLYQSNRLIMMKGDNPVLIFEEDCVYNTKRLKDELDRMVRLGDTIDVAVFGAWQDNTNEVEQTELSQWIKLKKGHFWYTHCVYYSARGRKKMRNILTQPQEVQYDFLLSFLATRGMIDLYLHTGSTIAWQSGMTSTLQTDMCLLCVFPGSTGLKTIVLFIITTVVISISLVAARRVAYDPSFF